MTPGADSRRELASTAHGRTRSIAARTLSGSEAAGEHDPAFGRGGTLPVRRVVLLPGEVEVRGDLLAVSQQDGVAAAHLALLAGVNLVEVRGGLARVADPDGDRQRSLGHRQDGRSGARALGREHEAEQVRACLGRGRHVVLPGQPADLDERTGEELAEFRRRVVARA